MSKTKIITRELAEKEIEDWFEFRKVRPDLRNSPSEFTGKDAAREALINSMVYGIITYNSEDGILVQALQFPVTKKDSKEIVLKELKFKPRLTRFDVKKASLGIKATDIEGKQAGYLSAVTGVARNILDKMDEVDRGLSDIIGSYFL